MINPTCVLSKFSSTLIIACALAVATAHPVAAQTANNLTCKGCVGTKDLKNKAVRSNKIRNNAVKSAKIRNSAVTNSKIANDAVTGAKVQNGSLTGADIQDASISAADLAPGTALGLSGVLHVPAAAFTPGRDNTMYDFIPFSGNLQSGAINSNQEFYAPVQLPDGVVITRLDGFMRDNATTRNISVLLRKLDPATAADLTMASVNTGGLPNSTSIRTVSETTILEPLVDAINSSYYLLATIGADASVNSTDFYGVRIFYD